MKCFFYDASLSHSELACTDERSAVVSKSPQTKTYIFKAASAACQDGASCDLQLAQLAFSANGVDGVHFLF